MLHKWVSNREEPLGEIGRENTRIRERHREKEKERIREGEREREREYEKEKIDKISVRV